RGTARGEKSTRRIDREAAPWIKRSMVRRRHARLDLSQVVLFGLVLPEPEADGAVAPGGRRGAGGRGDPRSSDDGVAPTLAAQRGARSRGHARRGGASDAGAQAPARLELRRAGA